MVGVRRIAILVTVVSAFAAHAFADDGCDAILKDGVRNTYSDVRNGDFRSNFQNTYCHKSSQGNGSSSGGGAGVEYAGFGFNFNQNSSDTHQSRDENCGSNGSSMSDAKFEDALQRVADPNIVAAWSACKARPFGLDLTGELNGNSFVLEFMFRAAGSISQTKINGNPSVLGAKCDTIIHDGTIITTGGMAEQCVRDGKAAVTIVVNSDFQAAKFYIPPVAVAPVKSKQMLLQEKCANWTGPGIPIDCLPLQQQQQIANSPPGMPPPPNGYKWCVLDKQFIVNNVQGYCFAREEHGPCSCAPVPLGYPQPPMNMTGQIYESSLPAQ